MTTILFLFQGHLSEGTKVLYDYLHKEPKMTMILGPFDNDLAKTVAAYAGLPDFGLLQVRISARLHHFHYDTIIIRIHH